MQPFFLDHRLLVYQQLYAKSHKKMKKYYYSFLICFSFFSDILSQEIRIKRQPFLPQPAEYYCEDKLIGNSTRQLAYFIETHSKDSMIIQQIKKSEKLSEIYPKIYLYSSIATGVGGLGIIYVVVKATGSIFKINNANPSSLIAILYTSFGFMGIGMAGISVAAGCFISSQIKLRKAIKEYNKPFKTDKVTINLQPYFQSDASGLTVNINF